MAIKLTTIKNPFDLQKIEERIFTETKKPLDYYLQDIPLDDPKLDFYITVNGVEVSVDNVDKVVPKRNSEIIVVAKTEAEGAAAWVTSTLFADATITSLSTAFAASVAAGLTYSAVYLASAFVIGYGTSLLLSTLGPDVPKPDNIQVQQTYGWGQLQNPITEGLEIPYLFGTNQVTGQLLDSFTKYEGQTEYLYCLFGICDHEIDSITDIKINDRAYTEYSDAEVYTRLGTVNDTVIPGFNDIITQTSINTKLIKDEEQIFTVPTSGSGVDAANILFSAPTGIYRINHKGKLEEREIDVTIKYRKQGDTTWILFQDIVWKTAYTSALAGAVEIVFPTQDIYEISITRTNEDWTGDSGDSYHNTNAFEECHIVYIQEILKDENLSYPGLAKYAVKIKATDQLSGAIPTFTCIASKDTVRIYDEDTAQWEEKRATNPAWLCYFLLSGVVEKERLIWEEWKEFAAYCDETIDGEYRFIDNIIIYKSNFWDKLQSIAHLARGVILRRGAKYGVFVDKLETNPPAHLFSKGNIIDGSFQMYYLPEKDAANAVEIEYTDPDKDYTRQVVSIFSADYLTDPDIQKKATVSYEASMPQAEAVRAGVFLLNSTTLLKRVITFDAAWDSFTCVVGDLFYFQDAILSYEKNIGGRIVDAGNDDGAGNPFVTFDQDVTIEFGKTYAFRVRIEDGTLVEKTISSAPTTARTFILTSAWSVVPDVSEKPPYSLGEADNYDRIYRITGITRASDQTRTITAIEYLPEIYTNNDSYVIQDIPYVIDSHNISNVTIKEGLIYDLGYKSFINVSWAVDLSESNPGFSVYIQDITETGHDIFWFCDTDQKTCKISSDREEVGRSYKVYIMIKGAAAQDLGNNVASITIQGQTAPPADVTNFTGIWDNIRRKVDFTWDSVEDVDIDKYIIRAGSSWETGTDVATALINSASISIPVGTNETITYWIKAVDKTENESVNATSIVLDVNTDYCALLVPTGLTLTSESTIASDGSDIVTLSATWDNNAEVSADFHHYNILLTDLNTSATSSYDTFNTSFSWTITPATSYGVNIRAVDVSGNYTAWSNQETLLSAKDANAPAIPVWGTTPVIAGFKVMGLSWVQNSEKDLAHYIVERSTVSDFSSDVTVLGTVKASFYSDNSGLDVSTTYYYRLKAVDTSGNESGYSSIKSGTTLQVGTSDIAYNSIISEHIDVNSLFVGMNLQSSNYSQYSSGWKIQSDGDVFFNSSVLINTGDQLNFGSKGLYIGDIPEGSGWVMNKVGLGSFLDGLSTHCFHSGIIDIPWQQETVGNVEPIGAFMLSPGDVVIGGYNYKWISTGEPLGGVFWDQSEGKLYIKGATVIGTFDYANATVGFIPQEITGDGSTTIDWNLGIKCHFTLGAQDETFTFTAPSSPCNLLLKIKQDSVGGRKCFFPSTVKWLSGEPSWSTGQADKTIIVAMYFDGTYYWGQATPWEV